MNGHPFKEFHEDAAIGNLIWRIGRRCALLNDSQEAAQIYDLERKIANDRAELVKLKAAYKPVA